MVWACSVTNGAGLTTTVASHGTVVHDAAPRPGTVQEVLRRLDSGAHDVDGVPSAYEVTVQWHGFETQAGEFLEYELAMGTAAGLDDLVSWRPVPAPYAVLDHVSLVQGQKYVASVRACNAVGLCSSSSSDGVVADRTPPIAGRVYHGHAGDARLFWWDASYIAAHWSGFADPESGVAFYEWCLGSAPGACDLAARRAVYGDEVVVKGLALAHGAVVFSTVVAVNHAGGQTAPAVSEGTAVDATAPRVDSVPRFANRFAQVQLTPGLGSRLYQPSRSILAVEWNFSDPESQLKEVVLTVGTHHDNGMDPIQEARGSLTATALFTGLDLYDGETYVLDIVACNFAGGCTRNAEAQVVVDPSRPSRGALLDASNSWSSQGRLTFRFKGFTDAHSGIQLYTVSVLGKLFELSPGSVRTVVHDEEMNEAQGNHTVVHEAVLETGLGLVEGMETYLFLTAVNGAGLATTEQTWVRLEGDAVLAVDRFQLQTRFCPQPALAHCLPAGVETFGALACALACTCTQGFTFVEGVTHCSNESEPAVRLEVQDALGGEDADLQAYDDVLVCSWRRAGAAAVLFYEYAFGTVEPGVGIPGFDAAFEETWHSAGEQTEGVFALRPGSHLSPGTVYRAFVRAYVTTTRFHVFSSDGVLARDRGTGSHVAISAVVPHMTVYDGPSATADLTYQTSRTSLAATWDPLRLLKADQRRFLDHFKWCAGSLPRTCDTVPFRTVGRDAVGMEELGLALADGKRYYVSLVYVDVFGAEAEYVSNGVMVDASAPMAGYVYTSEGPADVRSVAGQGSWCISWRGFQDAGSGVWRRAGGRGSGRVVVANAAGVTVGLHGGGWVCVCGGGDLQGLLAMRCGWIRLWARQARGSSSRCVWTPIGVGPFHPPAALFSSIPLSPPFLRAFCGGV